MDYILLDFEWNNAYSKSKNGFMNEIIEIGAVKLDSSLNEIDSFDVIIRSGLTNRLSNRFKELTNISNEAMLSGISFKEAYLLYKDWAGEDVVTLTWSNSDLYTLYENCARYFGDGMAAEIGNYIDLQDYIQAELALVGNRQVNQISLSNAAALFGITCENFELHRAEDDSRISAEILRRNYNFDRLMTFIKDTNHPGFYSRLFYKAYIITDIDSDDIDKEELRFKCPSCNKFARRKSKWVFKGRWFKANFLCSHCKFVFQGHISFKKHYDYISIKRRIAPIPDDNETKTEIIPVI